MYRSLISPRVASQTASASIMLILDPGGTPSFMSPDSEKETGYTLRELIDKPVWETLFSDNGEALLNQLKTAIETADLSDFRLKITSKGGHAHPFICNFVRRLNPAGETVEILATGLPENMMIPPEVRAVVKEKLPDSGEPLHFRDLFDIREVQALQDAFATATGVASIITEPDGTPITTPSRFCRLCQLIRGTEKGLKNCLCSDAMLGRYHPEGPIMQPCLDGRLWDGCANIIINGQHIANWLVGQVRNENGRREDLLKYGQEIGADPVDFAAALNESNSMSSEQFKAVCDTLFILANRLSELAYSNMVQQQTIAQLHEARNHILEREENLRITLESIGDAVIATDATGAVVRMNRIAEKLTGWPREKAIGQPINQILNLLHADTREPIEPPIAEVFESKQIVTIKAGTILVARNGTERRIDDSGAPIRDSMKNTVGAVMVFRDISEQYQIQEQLLQSEKMQVVGQLAGGIAHDFNNMLGGIMGAAEILSSTLTNEDLTARMLEIIIHSSERAADLTSKLLAFSRKEKLVAQEMDLHKIIYDAISLLEHSVDKRIQIFSELHANDSSVIGDATQMQNAIINLGLNARDAISGDGRIHIWTETVTLESAYCEASPFTLEPGKYIQVSVEDSGHGMDPEMLRHIFEPFFTTKEEGKGTGLGLAAVYGTVKSHHGAVTAYSEKNKGSVFHLYLPIKKMEAKPLLPQKEEELSGSGCILIIDDEEVIRLTARQIFKSAGYDVLLASDGKEGLKTYRENCDKISLVILDIVMPHMNGEECFREIRKINPEAKVIMASGFTQQTLVEPLLRKGLAGFIKKPFRRQDLAKAIRKALQ